MKNEFSIKDIIKYVASYDKDGNSSTKIDTKKEYDFLGNFLNGSLNILNTDFENEDKNGIYKYTDFSKKEKQKLFHIMNKLKSQFGDWTYQFNSTQTVNDENVELYSNRLLNFKLKLEELKSDENKYTKYYNNNKDEIEEIENKLKEYCTNKGFRIEQYDIDTLKKLKNTIEQINFNNELLQNMSEIKNILEQTGNDFKITNDFVHKYKYTLDNIIRWENNYIDMGIFSEEQKNLLKHRLTDYLRVDNEEITEDNINEYDLSWSLEKAAIQHEKIAKMSACNEKIQIAIGTSYKDKLKLTAINFINDNNISKLKNIPQSVDIGNGKFDKVSTQKTANCWIHAEINSLLATAKGTKLLENNYYRDENTGVITIHLKEAEDMGLHDGIYTITPQEIIDSQETLASGEGEISAYIIAIKKYFEEVDKNPVLKNDNSNKIFLNMDEGNAGFRFWEIITGGNYTEWNIFDEDKNMFKNGIGTSTSLNTEILYEKIKQGKCAATISLRNIAHNISIIGVKNNKFLIQESNNSETIFDNQVGKNNERIFTTEEPVNGRPTYGLSIDAANKYALGPINYIIWE